MSGRYMIIEFDEKESAIKLKKQIDAASRAGKSFRVVGYFAKPGDDLCVCDKSRMDRASAQAPRWNDKFGWHICATCKKPWPPSSLKNQLCVDKIINPSVYEAPHYKTGILTRFVNHILLLNMVSHIAPKEIKE